jgi:hypothetical protein
VKYRVNFTGVLLVVKLFSSRHKGTKAPRKNNKCVLCVLEAFEKCQFLFKFKKGDNFNHPREIGFAFHGAGRNTLNISRIKI